MKPLWEVVKSTLHIYPHPGQQRAWDSDRRFTFMLSGTQSGKTSFLPLWLWREIQQCGAGDYMAVTATFPLLQLKLLPSFLDIFEHTLHLGTYRAGDRVFEYRRQKTRVMFGSASHPESLESATAKAAILDEAGQDQFKLQSWEAVQRRLSLHQGRVLAGTTLYNLGWLRQQIYMAWQAGDPDIAVIQFPSIQNPAFPKAEFERAKARFAAWKFRMFYLGQFDQPPGLIYSDYGDGYREAGGHLVHPFDIPPEWPRYAGIDPGAVNTATIWLAHDPGTNVYYVYHETLEGGKTTGEHASRALQQAEGVNIQQWYLGAKSEEQQRLDWRQAGIWALPPAITDVEAGIDRVIELWKTRRLFIFDTCTGLRDELGMYSREVGEDGQPIEKIKDKGDYHRLDALRYVVIGLSSAPPAGGVIDDIPTDVYKSERRSIWQR